MQSWYKDELLPPDLETKTISSSKTYVYNVSILCTRSDTLLAQAARYGPPALFFSSRGGHSTTIVDARGRLVLKGRFLWTNDEDDELMFSNSSGWLGDMKRIEAIDVKGRSVLIVVRRKAIDLSDALLKSADCSWMPLPHFDPPPSSINGQAPLVWKMGQSLKPEPSTPAIPHSKGRLHFKNRVRALGVTEPGRFSPGSRRRVSPRGNHVLGPKRK